MKKKNLLECVIFLFLAGVWGGCSSDNDSLMFFPGHYPASPSSLQALPGDGRVQLDWTVSDSSVTGVVIFWNDYADSVTFPIEEGGGVREVSQILDLPEGEYDFVVQSTYDNGTKSSPSTVEGEVLGESYKESLKNRLITSATIDADGNAVIKWQDAKEGLLVTKIDYWDGDDKEHKLDLENSQSKLILENYNGDSSFTYQSLYKPGIDTFYAPIGTFEPDNFGFEEVMADKSMFAPVVLPGDSPAGTNGFTEMTWAWDGVWSTDIDDPYGGNGNGYKNVLITSDDGFPMSMTFDMGQLIRLTRFTLNHYYPYIQYDVKKYEIWGTDEIDGSGDWSNWTKLISYETPVGDASDFAEGDKGDFDTENLPAVRYIRIKCLENQGGGSFPGFSFAEITLWGFL